MLRIDVFFLVLATLCMLVGVSMGIAMGVAHDFQFAPVHAHLNLVGWASLALYGLVYRAYPAMGRSPLGNAHLVASAFGAVLFPIGIYVSIAHGTPGLAIMGSLIWLAGALLFLINLVGSVALRLPSSGRRDPSRSASREGFGPMLSENVR